MRVLNGYRLLSVDGLTSAAARAMLHQTNPLWRNAFGVCIGGWTSYSLTR